MIKDTLMKKAFSTVAVMKAPAGLLIEKCREYGYEGVEIRLDNDGSICGAVSEEDIGSLSEEFQKNGITVTNIGSSVCFVGYEAEQLAKAQAAIKIAHQMHARAIRVFLGYFNRTYQITTPKPDYAGIVRALQETCVYAQIWGVEIWVETHNEFATGKVLAQLIADVKHPALKLIWDIIHPIEDGESVADTWRYIGASIAHIHIKDGCRFDDPVMHDYRYTPLGEGSLPLKEIFTLLKETGFDGFASFEWESLWREELKGLDNGIDFVLQQYNRFLDTIL